MNKIFETFKALSDETRFICIALLLKETELCVCDFERALEITQSKTSRHLRSLLHSGLVCDRRVGTWVHYRISDNLSSEQKEILSIVSAISKKIPLATYIKRIKDSRRSENCKKEND